MEMYEMTTQPEVGGMQTTESMLVDKFGREVPRGTWTLVVNHFSGAYGRNINYFEVGAVFHAVYVETGDVKTALEMADLQYANFLMNNLSKANQGDVLAISTALAETNEAKAAHLSPNAIVIGAINRDPEVAQLLERHNVVEAFSPMMQSTEYAAPIVTSVSAEAPANVEINIPASLMENFLAFLRQLEEEMRRLMKLIGEKRNISMIEGI